MGRPVIHFEIGCRDSKKTQEFYTRMFGWTITEAGPAATMAPGASGIEGPITALSHEPYHYTTFYVDVEAVAAYLQKAESLDLCLDAGPRRQQRRPLEAQDPLVPGAVWASVFP